MRFRLGQVGPRGLIVLGIAALAGVALADHGWATYHGAAAPGSLGRGVAAATPAGPTSKPPARPNHAVTAGPTTSPGGAGSSPGPLLSSQSYAPYAFQVWPGPVTATAQAALTGLSISVHRVANGLSVSASVNGQPAGPAHVYAVGARVYVVEASMGDDSSNSDYNLGDDGLVVTDAQGRLLS